MVKFKHASLSLSKTGNGTNLINVGDGSFEVPVTSISSNVEVFGVGFLTNSSTFTAIVSSGLTEATSQLVTTESSKETRLSTVRIECIKSHELPLGGYCGTDNDNCKWTGTSYATLQYGVSHLKQKCKNDRHFPQTIMIVWNMTYIEEDIDIADQDVTVKGTTAAKKDARLAVVNLDIRPIAKAGLFSLEDDGDSLELNDVAMICSLSKSFRHILLQSTCQPISIVDCTFNRTKDSTGRATLSAPLI
ncbi:hypothetical protein BLNAU_7543 [Blattamonas nauphoetae]|uniref:Uncharacterized protein n=1 Tax=Blattamonas nauphoetae TaxID=2049346 RepID=A0ABQ9Y0X5_9EUKA|nr:hypothetical protein BLNAU_21598 [Blattamonas nauphoetae]KAK2957387.1 hypothetical protein BLNAU_7543 [Blattamonas nauphoetae]